MDYALVKDILSMPVVKIALTILAAFLVQFISTRIISRVVRHAVRRHKHETRLDEKKREKTVATIFHTAATFSIWVLATVIVLGELNVNIAAIATGAGLIGVVVGFGAQSTIGDILAGMFVIAENQYRVGDVVTLNAAGQPVAGVVEDITLRITQLRDLDGNLHTIRNGLIDTVTNSTFGFANVNIDIGVSYESDIDVVERVINAVGKDMADSEKWSTHIKEPIAFLRVDGFDDSSVRVKALGTVEPAKQWEVAGEFRRRIKKAFEKEGVVIPFPQVVVHTKKS